MKVRAIASTLLPGPHNSNNNPGGTGGGGGNGGAEDTGGGQTVMMGYLRSFLDILMELEKYGGGPSQMMGVDGLSEERDEDEEMELRKWAGLREYQKQFAGKDGL